MEEVPQDHTNISPTDKGKRAEDSPAYSSKKQTSLGRSTCWTHSIISRLPESDAPASKNTITAMLHSLQAGLHAKLRSSVSKLTNGMDFEDRTEDWETQLEVVIKAHDEMVDAHEEHAETIHKLQSKVADLGGSLLE